MLYRLARPALFALDAERAHELTLSLLSRMPRAAVAALAPCPPDDPVELMGLRFRNRVGLAAGLDKNGDCIEAFDALGFGFVEIGTVTPRAQPGNPRPRLWRLPAQQAIINRLGFNNRGVEYLVERVRQSRCDAVLGINIGKNADTPLAEAAGDYQRGLRAVHAWAGYVTVNVSSPNTRNLRDLQGREALQALLGQLAPVRDELAQREGRRAPLLLKIAPDLSPEAAAETATVAREMGVDGVIATNTTLQRPGLPGTGIAAEAGGLSGAPLRPLALGTLRAVRQAVGPDFPLVGVGGIMSGHHARERREAGADLVQVYSGFIYRGPSLVADCARALLPGPSPLR